MGSLWARKGKPHVSPLRIRKISTRVILLLFLSSALVATGMGGFHYYVSRNAQIKATANEMLSTAREKREALQYWITDSQRELATLTTLAQKRGMLKPLLSPNADDDLAKARNRFFQLMGSWVGGETNFHSVLILDVTEAKVVFSTWEGDLGTYKEDRPYYLDGRAGPATYGPYFSVTLSEPALKVSLPVKDSDGRTIAVAVGRLPLNHLGLILRRTGREASSFDSYLVSRAKLLVTQPRTIESPAVLSRGADTIGIGQCLRGRDGIGIGPDFRGVNVISAHLWIDVTQTCLVTQLDGDEALSPLNVLARSSLFFALAILVLSFALGFYIAGRIVTPIAALAEAADQVRQGKEPELADFQGKDEVGRLYQAFDEMWKTLQSNNRELSRHAQELEQWVAQRTHELAEAKALAENYLDLAGTLIVALDRQGVVTLVNRMGCEMLGLAEAQIVGKPWLDVSLPKHLRKQAQEQYSDLLRNASPRPVKQEGVLIHADGRMHLIDWTITCLHDGNRMIRGVICAGMDVTAQRQANLALKSSEERLKISQEIANIATWDLEFETGRIYWSEQLGQMLGIAEAPAEFTLEQFIGNLPLEERGQFRQSLSDVVESNGEWRIEIRVEHHPGDTKWLRAIGQVVGGEDGNSVRILGIVQDITQQRREEEALRHSQKIESLGNLAGGVAHSLNNLLVPIINLSDVVAEEMPADSLERQSLERIYQAAISARDLVAHILAFSRRDPPRPTVMDVTELVDKALELTRSILPPTIHLVTRLTPRVGQVVADAPQVESVFLNIINNAVSALSNRSDSRIEVNLKHVTLATIPDGAASRLRPGPYARISIADNGPGMTDEVRARIFDPFFTTKAVGEGTGLGLSTALGIVRDHGGDIEVFSQSGKGTRFELYLPLNSMPADSQNIVVDQSMPRASAG